MQLPDALQPWRPWLSWFSPGLAAELGQLVGRLHPLLGRFRPGSLQGRPEPDGLGDLRRRGAYERLLNSEWLLAADMPDEFLRRAASGEHLFLAPRPRASRADRLIVALFDAGPWQLGAPRLAQMAMWILLARRAAEAGGELRWGVWHEPGVLHEARSVADLTDWLHRRTYAEATGDDLLHWQRWLAGEGPPAGEVWRIGASLTGHGAGPAGVATHEMRLVRAVASQALDVQLSAKAGQRAMQLPLPRAGAGTLLLEGRFQAASTAGRVVSGERLSIAHDPLISAERRSVVVPLHDGSSAHEFVLGARHRTSPSKPSKPRRHRWRSGLEALAADFHGKTFSALLGDGEKVYFWQMSKGMGAMRPEPDVFEACLPPGGWMPCIRFLSNSVERIYVLAPGGRLVFWGRAAPECSMDATNFWHETDSPVRGPLLIDEGVLSMVKAMGQTVRYVRVAAGALLLCRADEGGRGTPRSLGQAPAQGVAAAFFAGQGGGRQSGCVAVRMADRPREVWRIHALDEGMGPLEAVLEPAHRAVGLVRDARFDHYALLTLAGDGRSLMLFSGTSTELLYAAEQSIVRVSVCPRSGLVALVTAGHQLICYSVNDRVLRLFVDDTGEAPDGDS